ITGLSEQFGSRYTLAVRGRLPPVTPANASSEVLVWANEEGASAQFNFRRAGGGGTTAIGMSGATSIGTADPGNNPIAFALRVNEATGDSRLVVNGVGVNANRAWPNVAELHLGGNTSGSTPLRERIEFAGIIPRLVTAAELLALGTV
ncbi:hypothetical protein, partial [Phenylobacterium sp.]|uniref:hypothetical protein n=1 Tax=Phenylobacterium sp. TaxID=1871053 RepID=UPI00273217C1